MQYISDNQNIDINELASDYASTNSSPPVFTCSSVFYADENSQSIGLVEVVDEDTDRSELMLWVSDGSGELAIDNDGRLYLTQVTYLI